jgi:hypothetical protein
VSLAVGLITGGSVGWECTYSLVKAAQAQAFDDFTVFPNTCYLDAGRNAVVKWFLEETEADKLLQIDTDISFRPTDVNQLEGNDLPCVAGVYYNLFDGTLKPVAKLLPENDANQPDDPLLEVEGVGAGFLMVTRELLEKMATVYEPPMAWFWEPIQDGKHVGEDFGFCQRVREMGEKVFVDLRVQVSHHKTIRISAPEIK